MIGTTVSHYKILEKLGEGGMGVVYKAQDTTLDRLVALKFLPDHVAVGSAELERFIQEAKAAAGLNHPNICTIYGIEESAGKNFIAMEFVDGQTLQEKKSSLSMKQALDVGIQIAEGLAAAHEKGIVHRDIKPENIMFRKDGRVQIMDFGLAKLRGASRLTKEGSTVGTAGYMSPEQVQGQETDHRSDIFSLGVLLYEMLSGQPPFKGVHETAIAYEIVNVDSPPMSSIKSEIPPELDAIILECLEKDPKERTQSASQVALALKRYRRESSRSRASRITAARPAISGVVPSPEISNVAWNKLPSRTWIITGVIALGTLILGFAASSLFFPASTPHPVIHASINMPAGIQYNDALGGNSAISPDGSIVAFVARDSSGRTQIWVRALASVNSKPLDGTDGATYPFWSHDSRSIGFFAEGSLRTISASGGPVVTLADAPFGRGAAWSANGTIAFSPNLTDPNLYAVDAGGGEIRKITTFDSTIGRVPRFPSVLPDGDHVLYSMLTLNGNNSDLYVTSLSNSESNKLISDGSNPVYVSGVLLFARQQILTAQRFDASSRSVSGQPVTILGNLNTWAPRAKADFSSSTNGILFYAAGTGAQNAKDQFLWVDDAGNASGIVETGVFSASSLSPDGTRIAFGQAHPNGGVDVWTYDIRRKVTTRLTFVAPNSASSRPVWSKNQRFVYYNSEQKDGKAAIFAKRSDGSGQEELLTYGGPNATSGYYPTDVSPNDRYLLFNIGNESKSEIALLDLSESKRPLQPLKLNLDGQDAEFSPDGKWIVFQSGRGTDARIVVTQFGAKSGTWQVSSTDGAIPHWIGSKIVYWSTALSSHMQVSVSFSSDSPVFEQPRQLFSAASKSGSQIFIVGYSKTQKAYLALRPGGSISSSQLSLIVNWPALVGE